MPNARLLFHLSVDRNVHRPTRTVPVQVHLFNDDMVLRRPRYGWLHHPQPSLRLLHQGESEKDLERRDGEI